MLRLSAAGALALCLTALQHTAHAIDLHAFWDNRCAECHSHAADFARTHLRRDGDRLSGSRPTRDLLGFLGTHESGGEHAGAIYRMLLAQVTTPPLFQQKCAGCHGTAASYARAALVLDNGIARTRDDRRAVVDVLARHGKVTPEEARTIADSLARVLTEIGSGKGG